MKLLQLNGNQVQHRFSLGKAFEQSALCLDQLEAKGKTLVACGFENCVKVYIISGEGAETATSQVFGHQIPDNASCVKLVDHPRSPTAVILVTALFDGQVIVDSINV